MYSSSMFDIDTPVIRISLAPRYVYSPGLCWQQATPAIDEQGRTMFPLTLSGMLCSELCDSRVICYLPSQEQRPGSRGVGCGVGVEPCWALLQTHAAKAC